MGERTVAVVTGSRADFGLLSPVMAAVAAHPALALRVVCAGAHHLPPAFTRREVDGRFGVDADVTMQEPGVLGRCADARALGRGVSGCAEAFGRLRPAWVVVLGDRVEALAAACSASVGGIAVAHLHGGDRAEGVADDAMRHAISKLAHLHLAATSSSAERLVRMGEAPERVRVVGSPAIDGLGEVRAMDDAELRSILGGAPLRAVVLLHPCGLGDDRERAVAAATARAVVEAFGDRAGVVCLAPNADPGSSAVRGVVERVAGETTGWAFVEHLERARFVSLLRRLAGGDGADLGPGNRGIAEPPRVPGGAGVAGVSGTSGAGVPGVPVPGVPGAGVLVGNSSAGLIEAAALGVPTVNIGPRQAGRERPGTVIDASPDPDEPASSFDRAVCSIRAAILGAASAGGSGGPVGHPFGDGRAGERSAALLAELDPLDPRLLRKLNAY